MGPALGGGRVRALRLRRRVLGLALVVCLLSFWAVPSLAFAATPSPRPGAAGDTRSVGEGPGLVGAPGLAILGVLGLGLGTALLTIVYVRLSAGTGSRRDA